MKKFLLSLVSLLMLTLFAQAGEVKINYTGTTTTNMTGGNDAALFGLSADDWSIVGDKGANTNFPGLNKAGDLRLYWSANGSNTVTVTVLKEGSVINKIKSISFNGVSYSNVTISVDGTPVEAVGGEYAINATSFVIGNGNTGNTQVRISSILLEVEGLGGEVVHIANTAETAYTVAEAMALIDAGQALDETVYVKGIVSQVDNFNDKYKSIQYWISDDGTTTNQFECYSGKGIGGADFASIDDVKVGASVIVKGTMKKYTPAEGDPIYEFNQSNELVSYEAPAEPVYIQNADFASLEGWTAVTSDGYKDLGNGLIGTYQVRNEFDAATVDESHLATEYCIGLEARWASSFASYTQTVTNLPAGSYSILYDVENVNAATTAANYENRFTVTVGETVYTDSFTEWMKGKSAWTTHAIVFTVEAGQQVTISLGYGTGSNNYGLANTPALFVSHLQLADAATGEALILANAKAEKLAAIDALPVGDGLFLYSQTAIDDAKAAVNGATTVDEVAAVAMPTPILPDAEKQYSLKLKDAETYMAINEGIKLSNGAYPFTFEAVEGGYALKNGENYVAFTGTGDNTWSMGATTAPYAWAVTALADGYYTLAKVSNAAHMIGVDDATAGSSCFANKNGDKAMWSIAEYVAPSYTVTIADGIENGAVVVDPTSANEGTTVKLTITPAEGYVLDALTVMNGEDPVEVAEDNTFVMPAANVVVSATFKEESPKNITNIYLVNADLSTIDNGWTYYSDAYKYQGWRNANNETVIPGVEFYAGWGSLEHTNFKFSQNVTLPAGDYRIVVNAFFREGAAGNGTNADKAWIFAGEKKQNVYGLNSGELDAYSSAGDDMNRALAAFKAGKFENAFDFSLAEETAIDLGFEGKFDDLKQWCILGPVKLYKYSLEDYLVAYREKVAEAEALYDSKMGSTELEALKATVKEESTFSLGSEVAAAITAMNDAITAAKASIAGYAELGEALTKGETYKANSSDEEAKTAYSTAVEAIQTAYEAGTVADLAAALATVQEALPALAKTQTADNSDLTAFIVNSTVNGADGWTIERPNGGNGPLLNNASFEYWAGNASSRDEAEFDYYQVIENLPNGFYTISAEMYNSLNGEDGAVFAATSGVYAAAGEAEVSKLVDVDGTEFIKYTTDKIAVTNGTLRIGVKNTVKPMAARWFVADNFKLTLVHAYSDIENAFIAADAAIADGGSYRIFTQVGENKFYLNNTGYLVASVEDATSFKFTKVNVEGTAYATGINLGCKFSNPQMSGDNGTGNPVANGHIMASTTNDRDSWERQVFFLNSEGKYAVRATNATGTNWGANTFWTVTDTETELPKADYSLDMNYVWQIEESAPELRPEAFAKTRTWVNDMQYLYGLVTEGSQWTSNAKQSSEGSYEALVDGDYTTFFHSQYNGTNPNANHYLQAELSEPVKDFYFYMKKRSQNNNNRPTDIVITASNDGENFTDVTEINEGLPTTTAVIDYLSSKISMAEANSKIRFTVTATNNGAKFGDYVFFTASEWYIIPSNEVTDAALKYAAMTAYTDMAAEDVEVVNALAEQISAAVAAKTLAKDLADLAAEVDRLTAFVDATETYSETTEGIAATTRTALSTVKETVYTSSEDIAAAKAGLVGIIKNFFAGIQAVTPIDVTEFYIVNPTPVAHKAVAEGWEGETFGDSSNGVSEYWNKSAVGFHQTINLPAGDYRLTGVALQRTGMTGYIYAGEAQTTIVQVTNSEANSRAQAAAWFAAGNGKNELSFKVAEAGDVVIGLTTDKDNGDHWTVWQSFKLEKIADVERANALSALKAALAANVPNPLTAGDGLFQKPQSSYEYYEAFYNGIKAIAENAASTTDDLTTALASLNDQVNAYDEVAVNLPKENALYVFQQKASGKYLSVYADGGNTGVRLSDEAQGFQWTATEGGYYLSNEVGYIGLDGANNWTMSALEEKKLVINALATQLTGEGVLYYTLSEKNGLIATDGTETGAACYADKGVSDKALWTIVEYVAPTTYAINIEEAENGKVESDKATAAEGETVTLTATPDEGYIPDDITITYGEDQKVEPVINEETLTATFVMPAGDVTIVMTFKEESGTGINGIAADQKEVIFDMNGRRVSRTAKGVLIVNGKKVVRK